MTDLFFIATTLVVSMGIGAAQEEAVPQTPEAGEPLRAEDVREAEDVLLQKLQKYGTSGFYVIQDIRPVGTGKAAGRIAIAGRGSLPVVENTKDRLGDGVSLDYIAPVQRGAFVNIHKGAAGLLMKDGKVDFSPTYCVGALWKNLPSLVDAEKKIDQLQGVALIRDIRLGSLYEGDGNLLFDFVKAGEQILQFPAGTPGSIHRFIGEIRVGSYIFVGPDDPENPLTFALTVHGYAYLYGAGTVVLPSGEKVQFRKTRRAAALESPLSLGKEEGSATDRVDNRAWTEASAKNDLDAYKVYLVRCPGGKFRDKAVSKILELLPLKFSTVDKETFLVASGWDYRKDMKIGYAQNMVIKDVEKGVFITNGGMPFIPLCMESEESKQKRKAQKDSGGFHFETLSDVIGVTWVFNRRGITFDVGGCQFMPLISGATVEFLDEGVRLRGFQVGLSGPGGKTIPILSARFSSIFAAAEAGDDATVAELIRNDPKLVSNTNSIGYTPLHVAAIDGHGHVVECLLRNGADINRQSASDKSGRSTPLHCAAYNGQLEVTRLLLSKAANIEAKEMNGCTPLHIASFMGENQVVELLISKGANLEAKDEKNGSTPLSWAVAAGKKDVVETLLSKGAVVNAKNKKGETPLSVATQAKNQEIMTLLERRGAN